MTLDLQIQVAAVSFRDLAADGHGEGSRAMRARVSQARQVQERRFARVRRVFANAQMTGRMVQEHCALGPEARRLLEVAVERLGLSARAYTRILKIAAPSPTWTAPPTSLSPMWPKPSNTGPWTGSSAAPRASGSPGRQRRQRRGIWCDRGIIESRKVGCAALSRPTGSCT